LILFFSFTKDDGPKFLAPMKTFDYGHTSTPTAVKPITMSQDFPKERSSKAALNKKKNTKKRLKRYMRVVSYWVN
jgi:hypothetical protein